MLQRIDTETPVPPVSSPVERLGRGWLILRNCRLGRPRGGVGLTALIHPRIGLALLDEVPATLPGAVDALRARLEAARFHAIFPGTLPVVHLCLTPARQARLVEELETAFADQPPLSLPGGDAWVLAVARALTVEPSVPRLQSQRFRTRRKRRAAGLLRGLGVGALLSLALLGLSAALLGHTPHPPMEPAVEDRMAAALPAEAPPAEAPLPAEPDPPAPPAPVPAEAAAPPSREPDPAPLAPPFREADPTPSAPPSPAVPTPPASPADRPARPVPGIETKSAASASRRPVPRRQEAAAVALPPEAPAARSLPPPRPGGEEAARLPSIAGAAAQPPPEPSQPHCRRILSLVFEGVLLPEEERRFFNANCVRR